MKKYLLAFSMIFSNSIFAYEIGDVLFVSRNVVLKYRTPAKWCPEKTYEDTQGPAFYDFKVEDSGIDTYSKKVPRNVENSNGSMKLVFSFQPECYNCKIKLKAGQRLRVVETSYSDRIHSLGKFFTCGRYYFYKLNFLDENKNPTGDYFTVAEFGSPSLFDERNRSGISYLSVE